MRVARSLLPAGNSKQTAPVPSLLPSRARATVVRLRSLTPPDANSPIRPVSSLAWAIAASDLGIRVTAPYVDTDRFGQEIEFVAHVRDFGTSRGTLVCYMPDSLQANRLRQSVFFISTLNPALYADYDRARFIALLHGWGWSGMGAPPYWYQDP